MFLQTPSCCVIHLTQRNTFIIPANLRRLNPLLSTFYQLVFSNIKLNYVNRFDDLTTKPSAKSDAGKTPAGKGRSRALYDVPYMFEAREFLRKKLIGKKVNKNICKIICKLITKYC